jgi:glycosyltransferase involved in cell wall biosynthesis
MRKEQNTKSICYLAPDVPVPGSRGSSVHVLELSKSMRKLGYKVHVIARRVTGNDPSFEFVQEVAVHRIFRMIVGGQRTVKTRDTSDRVGTLYYIYLRTIYTLYVSIVAAFIIWRNHLGLIIERETAFGAGAIASFLTRNPLFLEIIGPRYSRLSVRRSRKIFYYTDSMLKNWVPKEKCVKVPAGVDVEIFRPDEVLGENTRKLLGLKLSDFVFGYVGTFQKWHGLETLFNAVKGLSKNHREVKLLLVGPNFTQFKSLSDSLGLNDVCIFTGAVNHHEVPNYVNACDVMVALYEPDADPLRKRYGIGFPIKVLEYIACRKPVISTKVEPIINLFGPSQGALLIDQGNTDQLRSVMGELLSGKNILAPDPSIVLGFTWDELGRIISDCF